MPDQEEQKPQMSPFEFLQTFPNAPDQAALDIWKQQAPGARLRLVHSTDGKRIYIMRGIGASELVQVQNSLPAGIPPEKLPIVLKHATVSRCCNWTSDAVDNKLTDARLQASGAGLADTLQEVVLLLSDFMDPVTIERCSAEL